MLERVGPYSVVKFVGRGGLGIVYEAVDTRSGATVALKLMQQPAEDPLTAKRLAREFKALKGLAHPNIVRVLDAGAFDEIPYLVMELVDGLPLRNWLDATFDDPDWTPRAPSPPSAPGSQSVSMSSASFDRLATSSQGDGEATPAWVDHVEPDSVPSHLRTKPAAGARDVVEVLPAAVRANLNRPHRLEKLRSAMIQLADGLAFVHARKLVHRDLKPSNILVANGGVAKLVDFGLVKDSEGGGTTASGRVVGTFRYMSPEQARGEDVDGRSDLYGLGAVLYEMLCGRPAFPQTRTPQLLGAIVNLDAPAPELLNPEVDRDLAAIALKLLRKNPADRFDSAASLVKALKD